MHRLTINWNTKIPKYRNFMTILSNFLHSDDFLAPEPLIYCIYNTGNSRIRANKTILQAFFKPLQ